MNAYLSRKFRRLAFFCIMTVVWVHACNLINRYLWGGYEIEGPFSIHDFFQLLMANSLFRFGIPLFFAISGYMMVSREGVLLYTAMVKKRAKNLLGPFLVWSTFALVVTAILEMHPETNKYVISADIKPFKQPITQYSLEQLLTTWLLEPIAFQLWFLRSLFLYSLTFPLLVLGVKQYPKIYFSVTALLFLLSFSLAFVEGEGLLFFGLGIWLYHKQLLLKPVGKSAWQNPPIWAYSGIVLLSLGKTLLAFQPGEWTRVSGYFLHKFHQPLLLYGVWTLYDRLPDAPKLNTWDNGASTNFFIYGMHVPLLYYIMDASMHYFGKGDSERLILFFLAPIVLIGSCIILGL